MSQEKGAENVRKLAAYLASVDVLPERNGKANIQKIAEDADIDRQALYKNDKCKELLQEAIKTKGLRGMEHHAERDPRMAVLERENADLARKNSDLRAQVYELRRQIQKYKHIEEVYQQGRRVIP